MMDYYTNREFASAKFEILSEEDKEIDIQAIEEYEECIINQASSSEDIKDLARKYNILTKAIKQLDKKIK